MSFIQLLSTTDNVLVFLIVISVTVILIEEQVLFTSNLSSLDLLPFCPSIFSAELIDWPSCAYLEHVIKKIYFYLGKKAEKAFP